MVEPGPEVTPPCRHSREGAQGTPRSSFQSHSLPLLSTVGPANFPHKGQPVNIFSFADQMISVATTTLCHRATKVANLETNEPVKLDLQK